MTTPHKEITSGLRFPEGPVAMPDGSLILVEIARQTLTRVMPDGKSVTQYKLPDPMVTNVCFGGKDLRTAFTTLSMTGKLVSFEWPRPGLKLNYLNK